MLHLGAKPGNCSHFRNGVAAFFLLYYILNVITSVNRVALEKRIEYLCKDKHSIIIMPGFFESLRQQQRLKDIESEFVHVSTKQNSSGEYCVVNDKEEIIVPYNYYRFISPFRHGLARVQTGSRYTGLRIFDGNLPEEALEYKWGIINSEGKEVVKPEYDFIAGFDLVLKASTKAVKDGNDSVLSLRGLSEQYDAILNASNQSRNFFGRSEYSSIPRKHYEDFEGTYAQDVEGYSDEDIYDAFDGEPDAYWNID